MNDVGTNRNPNRLPESTCHTCEDPIVLDGETWRHYTGKRHEARPFESEAELLTAAYSRLATLESEREQIRRLLAEARPVVEELKQAESKRHTMLTEELADYYQEKFWMLAIDRMPALLALIEQIEGLSHE